jgi:hypothetical protein
LEAFGMGSFLMEIYALWWEICFNLVKKLVDGSEKNNERNKLERLNDACERNH